MFHRRNVLHLFVLLLALVSLGWLYGATASQAAGMRDAEATATATAKATNVFSRPFDQRQTRTPRPTRTATVTRTPTVTPSATPTKTPIPPGELVALVEDEEKLGEFLPDAPFVVRFTLPMDVAAGEEVVLTYPYRPGKVTWNAQHTELSFQPEGGFEPGTAYTIFVDRELKSTDGKSFSATPSWRIQVPSAPKLAGYSPAEGEISDRRPEIKLRFDNEMNQSSVRQALSVEPAAAFALNWQGNVAEISFTGPLAVGQQVRFTLADTAMDTQGVRLAQAYTWDYWIAGLEADVLVTDQRTIQVNFNYPISTTQSGLPFALDPPVEGAWAWGKNNRSAFFTAENYLPSGKRYTVRFTAPLFDEEGASFQLPDSGPINPRPAVMGADGQDGYLYGKNPARIYFSHAVDTASVEAAFSLQPETAGKISWNVGKNILSFTPKQNWGDARYTLTLNTSALGAQGEPLFIEPFVLTFSGYADYNDFDFQFGGPGANAQVLDADGSRAIQFSLRALDRPVTFKLYWMDLNRFVSLYKQHFNLNFDATRLIDTGGMEEAGSYTYTRKQSVDLGNVQEMVLPQDLPTGAYLLEARLDGTVQDQLFVVLTRNTLVVKRSGTRLWVWATNINGENVPDLEVRLYMDNGSILREGKTDQDGVYTTTMPQDGSPLLVAARTPGEDDGGKGDDVTIAGFTGGWQGDVEEWSWWWGEPQTPVIKQHYRGYIYTDRPIYKPGQAVNFKAVLRAEDDVTYSLPPENTRAVVTIHDARDNQVQAQELPLSAFGTLDGEFKLADGAMLGLYSVKVQIEGETYQGSFKVQEYHKPDYQVQIDTDRGFYADGDKLTLEVDARYFFGKPVAGAKAHVQLYRVVSNTYSEWWEDIQVGAPAKKAGEYEWYPTDSKTAVWGELDENGHLTRSLLAETREFSYYGYDGYGCRSSRNSTLRECLLGVEVTVDDGSGQQVSAAKVIKVYNAAEFYRLDAGDWLKRPGEEINVTAQAFTLDGLPLKDRALNLEVLRYSYSLYGQNTTTVKNYHLTTGADGMAAQPITLEEEGYYQVRMNSLNAAESQGLVLSDWVYVSASGQDWNRESFPNLGISAERGSYKPYEKAKLLITSTFDGPALLTFERGKVLHTKPIMLTAPLTEVEVEIIPEDAPNVYVVVNAYEATNDRLSDIDVMDADYYYWLTSLSNSRLRTAQMELKVDASARALNVTIEPDQQTYAPHQEATFNIRVTDAQNQPVEAELSLALVDEAIFTLSEDLNGAIFDAFYGWRAHSVSTYNSMALSRYLQFDGGGCGGGGGGGGMMPGSPRSNFPDTAFWLSALRTDASGQAQVTIPLPDSLTSWRLTVKAVTRSTKVGEAAINVLTQKDLLVRPMLPAELTLGDEMELTAVVHNYADTARNVTVELSGAGLELLAKPSLSVTLQPGEARPVSWWVRAASTGEAQVEVRAATLDGTEDAVRLPLPVRERFVSEVTGESGDFTGSLETVLVVPDNATAASVVELEVSRSIAGSVLDGLEYLTGYPYGCVEQTMSRALPNAVVGRAIKELGMSNPGLEASLPELLDSGLQRLYGYQHDDGGWGLWFDDRTDVYQTAWVVFGLSVTADAGQPVDPGVIERGAEYLQSALAGELDPHTRAYVLYSLAISGHGQREQTLALVERARTLDAFSQAALALALDELGEKEAAQSVLAVLDSKAIEQDGQVYWASAIHDGHYHDKTMSSTLRSTAMALNAYVRLAPDHERIPGMLRYLMARKGTEGWGTTNETAYTILALTDYLLAVQQAEGDAPLRVLLDGQEIAAATLEPGSVPFKLTLPMEALKKGANRLSILSDSGSGSGSVHRLYYSISSRMALEEEQVAAAGVVKVEREYRDPKTNQVLEQVEPGQLVRVVLTVTLPQERASYVLVEDHLPAGLEALNENLNTTAQAGPQYNEYGERINFSSYLWETHGYNNKEIRGGRVTFFITEFDKPWRVLSYLARATHAGDFTALPAEAYAMYDEMLWGRSSGGSLAIEPRLLTK